jgi:hypothetical protein
MGRGRYVTGSNPIYIEYCVTKYRGRVDRVPALSSRDPRLISRSGVWPEKLGHNQLSSTSFQMQSLIIQGIDAIWSDLMRASLNIP